MFDKFVPDKYFKSIYDINYESLKGSGIKCLIFDLTNTLEPEMVKVPSRKVKDLFEDLKDMGFKLIIIGDQLFFDILGANKMNLTSILVNPIGDSKFELSRLNRKLESVVINHLTKKDLFKRGRYYE